MAPDHAKRISQRIAAVIAAVAGVAVFPAAAGAVERVADGNFESTTVCNGTSCTSPVWTQFVSGEPPGAAAAVGPLCADPILAGGPASCAVPAGSGYTSQYHWARVGSSTGFSGGDDRPPDLTTWIEQQVLVPASPATLSFNLHIINQPYATGSFRAMLGGQTVFSTTDLATGYESYPRLTVAIDSAAGPGPKLLTFEGTAEVDPGLAPNGAAVNSDVFELDDVSLDAPDPPAAVTPPSAPPLALTPPSPTGQRAAALKKCKKKFPKGPKRKKCKRKANRLPI